MLAGGIPRLQLFRTQQFGVVLLCCPACSPGARHLRTCPQSERLLPLPGTPILGRLRGRYRGDEHARVNSLVWRTLELRGKRGAESFVELSWLGLGHRGRPEFYPMQASQSLVSLPRSTLVPEPRREVRREAAAWPVVVALPSRLRCIAWLPCVLVRFPRTVCYCSGEGFSQDYSMLVSIVAVLPQGLRYAVVLAGAFWWVFPEQCLGGSSGGSPRTSLRCSCMFSLMVRVIWVVHSSEGSSQDHPLSLLVEVLPRNALCSFRATIVLPLWFEVCRLVGLRSGEVLPGWLLVLLVEVLPKATSCCFGCRCSLSLCIDELSFLLGRCRSRHCALGRASCYCIDQLVSLFVFEFLGCAGG
ncbi:hypothetical protein Taro_051878, partial [Colocasia esculenta]|nr:hypothetical protein [Colocasia esculenta]